MKPNMLLHGSKVIRVRIRFLVILVLVPTAVLAIYAVCHDRAGAVDTIVGMSKRVSYGALYAMGFWAASYVLQRWMNQPYTTPVISPAHQNPQPSGPGQFKVSGVDHDTHYTTTEFIYAESPSNAQIKVELKGVDVASVERA